MSRIQLIRPHTHAGKVYAVGGALDALDDGGHGGAIVFELFGHVGHMNVLAFADVLVIGAFIRILEPAPATDVIDEDKLEVGLAGFHVMDELLQR